MQNEFYLTLLSNSSMNYFPNNTLAHFQTKLPRKITLASNWVVGLAEISFNVAATSEERKKPQVVKPRSITLINEQGLNGPVKIPIHTKVTPLNSILYMLRKLISFTDPWSMEMVGASQYDSNNDLNSHLNKIVNEYNCEGTTIPIVITKSKFEPVPELVPKGSPKGEFKPPKETLDEPQSKRKKRSADEPVVVITLPTLGSDQQMKIPLEKENYESVEDLLTTILSKIPPEKLDKDALLDVIKNSESLPVSYDDDDLFVSSPPRIHPSILPQQVTPNHERNLMFVYSDIIKPQLVSNTFARCLRTILLIQNSEVYKSFNGIQYFPLEKTNFDTIEILITSQSGEIYNFQPSSTPTMLVLHFRKLSENV